LSYLSEAAGKFIQAIEVIFLLKFNPYDG